MSPSPGPPSPRRRSRWILPSLLAGLVALVAGAGAGAAVESDTVGGFGQGLWWAISLMTTSGYLHGPPESRPGELISIALMIIGFLMLSLVSAALAAIFVRDDVAEAEELDRGREEEILELLTDIQRRLTALETARDQ